MSENNGHLPGMSARKIDDDRMTNEKFMDLERGKQFAHGTTIDSPDGVNMTNSGKRLKWVAVKGWNDDWCIYVHWAYNTWDYILMSGDKVNGPENIRKLVPCTDEVFKKYRY